MTSRETETHRVGRYSGNTDSFINAHVVLNELKAINSKFKEVPKSLSTRLLNFGYSGRSWIQEMKFNCTSKICTPQPNILISTDSSDFTWGAIQNQVKIQGLWRDSQLGWHINIKELIAAFLALQLLVSNCRNVHIQLSLDNTTAVAYLNHQVGTKSVQLSALATKIWCWCLERSIYLSAIHIPGLKNLFTDPLSCLKSLSMEWMLNRAVFCQIVAIYGLPDIDLFTSALNHQIKRYVSWIEDPRAQAKDAFSISWGVGSVIVCIPSFQLDPQMPAKGDRGQSSGSPCGFDMEVQTMVSNITGPSDKSAMFTTNGPSLISSFLGESAASSSQSPQLQGSRVASIRQSLLLQNIPERVSKILLASWKERTEKQYESAWKQFCRWCHKKSVNPFSCHLDSILLYLSYLYEKGLQYRTINSHRSAISMTHLPIDNVCFGVHPLVSRLMKAIFNIRPAVPKYFKTWDILVVLKYLISLSPAPFLSLKKLTLKLVMIMAIIKASRADLLHKVDLQYRVFMKDGVLFRVPQLTKTGRPRKPPIEVFGIRTKSCMECWCKYKYQLRYMAKWGEGKTQPWAQRDLSPCSHLIKITK